MSYSENPENQRIEEAIISEARMSKFVCYFVLTFMLAVASMNATADPLSGQAKQLYDRAAQEARLTGISPEVVPTQDGRSFFLVWEPQALKGNPQNANRALDWFLQNPE